MQGGVAPKLKSEFKLNNQNVDIWIWTSVFALNRFFESHLHICWKWKSVPFVTSVALLQKVLLIKQNSSDQLFSFEPHCTQSILSLYLCCSFQLLSQCVGFWMRQWPSSIKWMCTFFSSLLLRLLESDEKVTKFRNIEKVCKECSLLLQLFSFCQSGWGFTPWKIHQNWHDWQD